MNAVWLLVAVLLLAAAVIVSLYVRASILADAPKASSVNGAGWKVTLGTVFSVVLSLAASWPIIESSLNLSTSKAAQATMIVGSIVTVVSTVRQVLVDDHVLPSITLARYRRKT